MDHVPWPGMRSVLALKHTEHKQDDFYIPWCENLSVNWPHDPRDSMNRDDVTGQIVVSSAFEQHLRTLNNWSLGADFARKLPKFVGTYRET